MKAYKLLYEQTLRVEPAHAGHTSAVVMSGEYHYQVPYERNDEYIKLVNQMDATNPESLLEPEMGATLYADFDYEYNYYAEGWERLGRRIVDESYSQGILGASEFPLFNSNMQSLNLFLLSGSNLINSSAPMPYDQVFERQYQVFEGEEWWANNPNPPTNALTDEKTLSKEYFNQSYNSYYLMKHFGQFPTPGSFKSQDDLRLAQNYLDSLPGANTPEFINLDMARIYADIENKREMFPYFSEFKLTGVRKNSFCRLLEDHELVDEFVDFLVMHRVPDALTENVEYEVIDLNTGNAAMDDVFSLESGDTRFLKESVYGYSLNQFLYHLQNHAGTNNIVQYSEDGSTCSYIEAYLKQLTFMSNIETWIHGAAKNQAFPVAFRLEKHLSPRPSDNPQPGLTGRISTHYFFNYTDLINFYYYDTQIAYDSSFTYKVKVINGYVSSEPPSGIGADPAAQDVPREYAVYFFEEPYYSESIYILDSPPVPPDVELITYRGISDKLLILFNQQVDKEAAVPVYINESDSDSFSRQYAAQNIDPLNNDNKPNPIIFESDDPTDFELFKLTKKPTSYADFANLNYRLVSSKINGITGTSTAYHDNIIPNQYYYYTFRAQDMHGFVSNPTPVYEFVLIKEGETMYPRIRIVDFRKPDPPTQKTRSFKRYLKIGFSPRQYTIGDDAITTIDDDLVNEHVDVGIAVSETGGVVNNNIIGSDREFKFRIKSKNTGKLIDFNVTFKKNRVIKA